MGTNQPRGTSQSAQTFLLKFALEKVDNGTLLFFFRKIYQDNMFSRESMYLHMSTEDIDSELNFAGNLSTLASLGRGRLPHKN
jgi:hypothetical protein